MDTRAETLLADLCQLVIKAKLSIETKILICMVCRTVKNFETNFDQVS